VHRLLLDTHALLWALTEPARLPRTLRKTLQNRDTALLVSAATAWEIATKCRLGRLPAAEPLVLAYEENLAHLGAEELPVTARHALAAGSLAWEHRDPFDRMLAAQSILESVPLVSMDTAFSGLGGLRTVW
jgi:PIN domain nuclease of toxin-antitoxin system